MQHLSGEQLIAALVIVCLSIFCLTVLASLVKAILPDFRAVVQWFRNLPFMYGWRVQRWLLGRLGLTLCCKCGLWVDRDCHRMGRCPGEQRDQLVSINESIVVLDTRLDTVRGAVNREASRLSSKVDNLGERQVIAVRGIHGIRQDIAPLQEKVRRLEASARLDLADIRTLKSEGQPHHTGGFGVRFFVFAGWECYPNGGCGDYVGAFDTIEEATSAAEGSNFDWAHIAAVMDGKLVVVWPPDETGSA